MACSESNVTDSPSSSLEFSLENKFCSFESFTLAGPKACPLFWWLWGAWLGLERKRMMAGAFIMIQTQKGRMYHWVLHSPLFWQSTQTQTLAYFCLALYTLFYNVIGASLSDPHTSEFYCIYILLVFLFSVRDWYFPRLPDNQAYREGGGGGEQELFPRGPHEALTSLPFWAASWRCSISLSALNEWTLG